MEAAEQMAQEMREAMQSPRSPSAAAEEGVVLFDLSGNSSRRPAIVVREILAVQQKSPRSREDTLYTSADAAALARRAGADPGREAVQKQLRPPLLDERADKGDSSGSASKFRCQDCDRSFKTEPGLKRHRTTTHLSE